MGIGIKSRFSYSSFWIGILFLLFVANYILQYFNISTAFSRNYLDDLLAMPVILGSSRAAIRFLYNDKTWQLEFSMVAITFILVCVLFEVILPYYSDQATADISDVICYGIGVVLYQLLLE
jgi:uncharacterized membrane protein YwzB